MLTLDGAIQAWNAAAERVFGHSSSEAVGRSVAMIEPRAGGANGIVDRMRRGEWREDFDTTCLLKDGTCLNVSFRLSPIRDEVGIAEFLAIGRVATNQELATDARDLPRAIFDDFPALVWRSGVDGKCDYFNRTWLEFTGRAIEDELGDGWADGIHPDDRERTVQDYLDAFHARQPFVLEYRLRRHDGEYRSILDFGRPGTGADGRFSGYIGSCYDITDRTRTAAQLQRSEEMMAVAQRIARFGSWELDLENPDLNANPLRWSDETYRIFGFEPRSVEVTNELFFRLVPPEDRGLIEEAIGRVLRERAEYEIEHRIIRDNGEVRFVHEHAKAFVDPQTDKLIKMIGTVHDITERKRAEEQLHRFLSMSPAVLYALKVLPDSLQPLWTSENMLRLTGFTEEESLQANWWFDHLHPEDRARARAAHPRPYEIEHQVLEFRFQRKDGSYLWIHDEKQLLRDAQGNAVEVVGVWTDATERVQLEQQLLQSQKMEAIGTLAGGVAHDFNNLLTVIQGHSSLLLASPPTEEELTESITQIAEAAERGASLTKQLLIFSRKQFMEPVVLDLNEVISNLTKMLARIVGEDIILTSELAPKLPLVHGDRGMIEQILLNLTVNARDAMPRGGRLTISTSAETADAGAATKNADATPGPGVCLSVRDTGCGIPPETLSHIFEPFFTTKAVGKGTGLGLATTYGIVKLHRGSITVESEVNRGSEFRIHLPVTTGVQLEPKSTAKSAPLAHGPETILVVEDEPPVRELVVSLLTQLQYRALQAPSGVAALEVWRTHRDEISLLLTDMVMPDGMTGRELAERLLAEKPTLRVIYTSGYSPDIAGGDLPLAEGGNFLQKPYTSQRLAKALRDNLDRR